MKELDEQTLAEHDGEDDRTAYVAYEGKVYDVSASKMWKGGVHMKRHRAGGDLTDEMSAAPHGDEVLERVERVGTLKQPEKGEEEREGDERLPGFAASLLETFPSLRRHPHPMVVHFPIVFAISAALFSLLYLATGVGSFETTALHSLGASVLFTPVAYGTGWFTWWLNYGGHPMKPVTIKKTCTILLFAVQAGALTWRLISPEVLTTFRDLSFVYLVLLLTFIPLVAINGWYGGNLVFPEGKS